jgi:hypothetical protein
MEQAKRAALPGSARCNWLNKDLKTESVPSRAPVTPTSADAFMLFHHLIRILFLDEQVLKDIAEGNF